MKALTIFLTLFLTLFSPVAAISANTPPSVKQLLQKLENDIKAQKDEKTVNSDVEQILKAKEELPISFVPELNYLTGRKVELLPETSLTTIDRIYFTVQPVERALEALVFLIVFYTFIFYFQHASVPPRIKQLLTLASTVTLTFAAIARVKLLFFFLTGLAVSQALGINKRRTTLFLALSGVLLIALNAVNETILDYERCPKFLYKVKVERDGYAPPFLIERAIREEKRRKLELITNDIALGELQRAEELKKMKFKDPTLRAIAENDLGFVSFVKGDYKKALEHFKRAENFLHSPTVLFNLYLTYTGLLELQKAEEIKKELVKEAVFETLKASTVPLLIHVPPDPFRAEVPLKPFVALFTGIGLGFLLERRFGPKFEKIETSVLSVPGMIHYVNSRIRVFILVGFILLLINVILGQVICR
jgi:tetratricopeptide (TPR) repeat protein